MFDPEKPPELAVTRWVNTADTITLAGLRDKVVVLVAFQMLCPGCIEHGLPQAKRLRERFHPDQVAVIGLHTVFEHHAVMTPAALEVFMSEFKWPFPVGIDTADASGIPKTMAAYQMQGTPTLLLFDRGGRLRRHYFGRPDDIMLAAEIMALAIEEKGGAREQAAEIERRIAATLVTPGHDHHGHDHVHGEACDHDHHHDHGHRHDHTHDHGHGQRHAPDPSPGERRKAATEHTHPNAAPAAKR